MNKYLKFEYWNTCDLGNIYYQGGQHFIFYLDADVGEPIHEEVEEGQENGDGDFIPTYRRQMKRYRIRTGLIPDYLIDAIQRMKLHDTIELTFKSGEVEQIYNVDCEPEWQFEKYAWQGTMTLTFDMDESITVGACCDNLVVQTGGGEPEPEPIPDLYWVAETGNISGDGTYANPWATLGYAVTQVTTPGETINMKAGTYTITSQVALPVGISIKGQGDTTVITSNTTLDPIILARSTSEGVNGDQTISYIRFDGNATTANRAIVVNARSNVLIHNCSFVNFLDNAVRMTGQTVAYSGEPTTYATGNRFYSNSITDCAKDTYSAPNYNATGGLEIAGQSGMLIYDNYISGGARYGYGIKGVSNYGYFKGLKIYDNTIITNNRFTAGAYDFAIELWSQRGGIEIYRNRLWGALDLGGYDTNDEGSYGYAARVFDNDIGRDALPAGGNAYGITIELGHHGGLYIYRNRIHHVEVAIDCQTTSADIDPGQEDIYIYYNLFYNLGLTSGAYSGKALTFNAEGAYTSTWDDIYFVNNVVYNPTLTGATIMDCEDSGNTFTNIVFRNNICQGFYNAVKWDDGTVDGLSIENNLTYLVTNLHNLTGVSNDVIQNNVLATDPEFVNPGSDFRLQSTSDAINEGIALGLSFITADYAGRMVADPPEIGAYEY